MPPALLGSQASPCLQSLPFCHVVLQDLAFLSLRENLRSQAAPGVPLGLEDQAAHLPQRVLGFLEVLEVRLPLAILGAQGGPSFQLAQEAPYLLAALSNLGHLDYLEPQGVLVGLEFLVHLSHRNDQAPLGYLEIQKFLLCLWDLSDLGVQEHQLPLLPLGIQVGLWVLSSLELLKDLCLQGVLGGQMQDLRGFLSDLSLQVAREGPGAQ